MLADPETNNQITLTESKEKEHIKELSGQISQAIKEPVQPEELIPIKNQSPLPQFEHPLAVKPEEVRQVVEPNNEFLDIVEGWQGKPRTANAIDFLKDKLAWMKKKHGSGVTLKK